VDCQIKGFQENTLIDWDGKICSTVFLPYCNFRCPFCHARALVLDPDSLNTIPVQTVLDTLNRLRGWLDGVVVCGGEPTVHEGIEGLIRMLRETGMAVKLDTNGSMPGVLERLFVQGLVDYVAMDVKAPLDERYYRACGLRCDLEAVSQSVRLILNGTVQYEFRTTVCPAVLSFEDVVDLARGLEGAKLLALQQFRPHNCLDPAMEKVEPWAEDVLNRAAQAAAGYVEKCIVR